MKYKTMVQTRSLKSSPTQPRLITFHYRTCCTWKPMWPWSLWAQQSKERDEWSLRVLVPAQLYWQPTKLPAGVHHQLRVQLDDGLHQPEVCRPLSRSLRLQCQVPSGQSQSYLSVPCRIHRRSFCSMRLEAWVQIFLNQFMWQNILHMHKYLHSSLLNILYTHVIKSKRYFKCLCSF